MATATSVHFSVFGVFWRERIAQEETKTGSREARQHMMHENVSEQVGRIIRVCVLGGGRVWSCMYARRPGTPPHWETEPIERYPTSPPQQDNGNEADVVVVCVVSTICEHLTVRKNKTALGVTEGRPD
jgi:hypothetical protein